MKDEDIEISKLLYALRRSPLNQIIPNELFDKLLNFRPEISKNFERFEKGFEIQYIYKYIYHAMPYVKNINDLGQKQEEKHKKSYQVPDYTVFIENSQKEVYSLLVEVKSVENKSSLDLMGKQVINLKKYAEVERKPFLIAIYWKQYGLWTHNCLDNFEKKGKKYKIHIENAIKNDLSHIFGDVSFMITKPPYRKTIFDSANMKHNMSIHEKYGEIRKVYIGNEINNLKECEIIESAIVDSVFEMDEVDLVKEGKISTQIEVGKHNFIIIKLSIWIIRLLKMMGIPFDYRYNDVLISEYTRKLIIELTKALDYPASFQMPFEKTPCSDEIYRLFIVKQIRD